MDGMPPGWEAKWDPRIARWYYVNHSLRTTQWEDPRLQYGAVDTNQKLVDEVIQLCCPELQGDQGIRDIVKEMVEVNNGNREVVLREVKEMMGKNDAPISDEDSEDDRSDGGFDSDEYEAARREAEEEVKRAAEKRQKEADEAERKEAEERRLRLEKQEKMKRERQRARQEEARKRKERANILKQQNSKTSNMMEAFGQYRTEMDAMNRAFEINIERSEDFLIPTRSDNIFGNDEGGPRAIGPGGLHRGPDKTLRIGRDKSLAHGPDKSLRSGPDSTLACGADLTLRGHRHR